MFSVRSLLLAIAVAVGWWLFIRTEAPLVNPYPIWYENRIKFYYDRLDTFAGIRSLQKRMVMRHTFNYDLCRLIAERLKPGDTLLLPPRAYANQFGQGQEAIFTDARIFRYLSESSVPLVAWEDLQRRSRANIAIALEPTAFELLRRRDVPVRYDSLIAQYSATPVNVGVGP
jgi:hypothetical protein